MDKLNKIRKVLSAQRGTKVPSWVTSDYKYVKNNGSLSIYSKDGREWYKDLINSPTIYYGTLDGFKDSDLNFQITTPSTNPPTTPPTTPQVTTEKTSINGNKPETSIPGATSVSPTSAVETAAEQNQKVQEEASALQIKEQAALQVTKSNDLNLPEIKGLNISSDASKGMNLVNQQLEKEKQEKERLEKEKIEKTEKVIADTAAIASTAFKGIGEAMGAQQMATDSNTTKIANQTYNVATDTLKKTGPVGQIVGEALGNAAIAGDIIQSIGGGTDQMTSADKWMDSSFFSWNVGMINGFGGKKSDTFAADKDVLENVGSSYGGTSAEIMDAVSKSGKKYGLFSSGVRKRANRAMAAARAKQNIMADISDEATDQRLAVQSMGEQAGLAYSLMTDSGYNQKYTYAAKHGGTLEWNPEITLDWEPLIELNWELPTFKEGGSVDIIEELEWVPEFKEGDKTEKDYPQEYLDIPEIEETTQKNVIPEGALHKNKHHMEHAEGLTKKGIPVIDEEGEQQAEIELNEIIFTLEVTKKLEEYYEVFYSEDSTNKEKEQAALEAGKLLVYEILENTDDRTGLIESCKQGGSLTLKKSTDNLIEEALEWVPNIIVIEETVKEIIEPKKENKEKSEKEQMKEAIKEVLIELLTKQ